jgi:hypothetical protein
MDARVAQACSTCPFTSDNAGALATHSASCLRKRKRRESASREAAAATAFRILTRDDKGRKLWTTDHNDVCENCSKDGELLLCSYCNTSWHLQCTAEGFLQAPDGFWMCSLCVEAELNGEDMMEHGIQGEDAAIGAAYDPAYVDADDLEGETDISEAAYEKADIFPFPTIACNCRKRHPWFTMR